MPGRTTSTIVRFWYVYVLESEQDKGHYVGITKDLHERLKAHNDGRSSATKPRRPLKYIYVEACLDVEDAKRREKYLKTTGGRRFLSKRLKSYLANK